MDDGSNSRLSSTRSPPRERRNTMQLPQHNQKLLDQDWNQPKDNNSSNKDGFVEKQLEPLHPNKPVFHPNVAPNKPAMKKVSKKSTKSKRRRAVRFSDQVGTIPPLEVPEEEEVQQEESNDKVEDLASEAEENRTETTTATTTTNSNSGKERLTAQERKARRESALKEAKLAAKNVKKQNRSNRKLLGNATSSSSNLEVVDEQKPIKSKGLFGGLFSSKNKGKSNPRADEQTKNRTTPQQEQPESIPIGSNNGEKMNEASTPISTAAEC